MKFVRKKGEINFISNGQNMAISLLRPSHKRKALKVYQQVKRKATRGFAYYTYYSDLVYL